MEAHKIVRRVSLLFILLLVACATGKRPPAPDAATRNAGIAYHRLLATYRDISNTAYAIARREIATTDFPKVVLSVCHQQCDAAYFQCVIATMPSIPIPDFRERTKSNFPFDIPECEIDCSKTQVSPPPGSNCESVKQACDKGCECARLPTQ